MWWWSVGWGLAGNQPVPKWWATGEENNNAQQVRGISNMCMHGARKALGVEVVAEVEGSRNPKSNHRRYGAGNGKAGWSHSKGMGW